MATTYKILALGLRNYRNLSKVELDKLGHLLIVLGPNGSGKSNFIEGFQALLKVLALPEAAICDGASQTEGWLDLVGSGGEKFACRMKGRRGKKRDGSATFVREYHITQEVQGRQLEVTQPDAFMASVTRGKVPDLGEVLDHLRTPEGMREFARDAQAMAGLDVAALDAEHQAAFEARKEAKRDAERVQGTLDTLPNVPDGTPSEPVSIGDLSAEIGLRRKAALVMEREEADAEDAARRAGHEADAWKTSAAGQHTAIADGRREIKRLEAEIERIKALEQDRAARAAEVEAKAIAAHEETARQTARAEELRQRPRPDVAEAEARMEGAERLNAWVRLRQRRADYEREAAAARAKTALAQNTLDSVAERRRAALAAANCGIEGLAFGEDGSCTYRGELLSRLSVGQQGPIVARFLIRANPQFPYFVWRQASLLDYEHLDAIRVVAEEENGCAIIERVSEKPGGLTIVVAEDGSLPNLEAEPTKPDEQADDDIPLMAGAERRPEEEEAWEAWKKAHPDSAMDWDSCDNPRPNSKAKEHPDGESD